MRLPVTSPPLFTSLQYLPISKQVRDLRKKREKKCEYAAFFFLLFFSNASQETGGQNQQPSPRMQGAGLITTEGFFKTNVFSFTLSFSFSHTLLSQRCCAVSHAGKVPFPSISGRLQRSIIREINGTGPISCLVPFESAKLLRTSKKMRQFIWGLASLLCKRQTHKHTHTQTICPPPPPSYFEYSHNSNVHTHEHINKYSKLEQL